MKYSLERTNFFANQIKHNNCLVDLNFFICKEGCLVNMPFFLNNEVALDLDEVERNTARVESRQQNKSMDSAFVVKNDLNNESIVLVEFRFNYRSMRNLKAKDLRGKKKFSSALIKNMGFTNIHTDFYYVFDSNLKEQARRYFRSLYPHIPNKFKPVTIDDIKELYF